MARKKFEIDIDGVSLDEAYEEYIAAEKKRINLEMEFAPLLKPLDQTREDAEFLRKRLALVMDKYGAPMYEDEDFEVTVTKQRLVDYDPRKLPQHVRQIPGAIVEKVDRATIERALQSGVLDEEDVAPARTEKFKSPYVTLKIKTNGIE